MPLFSRGAICVPLDDQEPFLYIPNVHCLHMLLPMEYYAHGDSHLVPHGSFMQNQNAQSVPKIAICK